MEHQLPPPPLEGLTRRDFLKILSISGGALLLGGCGVQSEPTLLPTFYASLPPETPPDPESTATILLTPSPTDTPSQAPKPLPEYLPAADGSYTTYPLPSPQFPNFMPLVQALQERHSSRDFQLNELPVPVLSAILWAGFGVNRPDGKRTSPSAYNVRDIDIYLVTGKGLFRYDANRHSLSALLPNDLRPYTGTQGFAATAPLDLVYVSDYGRMDTTDKERMQWSWVHTGFIAQNVYLACAALGLATVVRSTIDRQQLGRWMELSQNQNITLAQTLGYPAN
jgi:nitroreductase